jgi:hypothetical protein
MIQARPFEDLAAMAVLSRLDAADQLEAELTRGASVTTLSLFADWRAMEAYRAASFIAFSRGRPFAMFALGHTGQKGVASAALLACDHARHRRPLAELALTIRNAMPAFCIERGIHRIEARAWADHPTASTLLTALGFRPECDMPGFGLTGQITFRQFAWLSPALSPSHRS